MHAHLCVKCEHTCVYVCVCICKLMFWEDIYLDHVTATCIFDIDDIVCYIYK